MDAKEIKARLDMVDQELAAKLRELGFTEDEIKRQLDNSIPQETRKAEAEEILSRKFVEDLKDPNSKLSQELVDRVIDEAETQYPGIKAEMAKDDADKKRRRKNQLVLAGVALVAIGVGVWYFAIRDARSDCEKITSLAEMEQATGLKLKKGFDWSDKRKCEIAVDGVPFTGTIARVEIVHDNRWYEQQRHSLEQDGYAKAERLDAANGWLFVAEKTRERSSEELMADAQSRVGKSRDPIGDALSAGGPSQHVVLFEFGTHMAIVHLSNRSFTPEQAKATGLAMAKRAKAL